MCPLTFAPMSPASYFDKVQNAAEFLRAQTEIKPLIGVILGSGLGGLVQEMKVEKEIAYHTIPNFPTATVEGHEGKLLFGQIEGKQVVVMSGRFHYYEGYRMEELTFPVRVMKALGVQMMIVSNAAGAMNPNYKVGDIVLIEDHINLFPEHPLRGPNEERFGTRFPDMSEPYDLKLIKLAKKIAVLKGIKVKTGVYVGLQGPTFETRAEYQYLRNIGGDLVGMSTVPEVIVAIHSGMSVFGASIVTDIGIRTDRNKISHEEVLAAANASAPKLAKLVMGLIKKL